MGSGRCKNTPAAASAETAAATTQDNAGYELQQQQKKGKTYVTNLLNICKINLIYF